MHDTLVQRVCGSRKQADVPAPISSLLTSGKLDMLRVECSRCERNGRYSVRRLIEKHGRQGNMMKWKEQLNGDCPRQNAPQVRDRCDLISGKAMT